MKKLIALLFPLVLCLTPAHGDGINVPASAVGTATIGQIPGTTTNDNAAAGKVGEFVQTVITTGAATVTFTNASPTVVTWTAHPYAINASGVVATGAINFTNSGGALPTGVSAATNYYFVPTDANSGRIATSVANALAGTFVNTSSTGTGTQTGTAAALLSTGSAIDIAGLALTAGDWQCNGSFGIVPAGSTVTTIIQEWINSTSVSPPSIVNRSAYFLLPVTLATGSIAQLPLSNGRFSFSATSNVFLSSNVTFSISTNTGFGEISCTRMR